MKYDVIIIGAGLAGLSAGAILSKGGKRVLILEQHHLAGGCATKFKRKDYTFEVSVHELNGIDKHEHLYEMYKDLDVFENLEFLKISEFYRWVGPGQDIVIPDDAEQIKNLLIKKFPHEEKGIHKYFSAIFKIRNELFKLHNKTIIQKMLIPLYPLLYPNVIFNMKKTVGKFLDSIINDEKLKMILIGNLIYYHDDPYTMSLLFFSVAQTSYYAGSYYIQGGSQELSDHLANTVISNGGKVILRQLVTKIIVEDGKAVGVEYKQKKNTGAKINKVFARHIISNSAVPNVANELLNKTDAAKLQKKIKGLRPSPSLLTVYIGFNTNLKKYGVKHYSTVIFDESCKSQADIYKNHRGDFSKRNFLFVDYGQVDSKLAPEGKSVGSICTTDYLSDWEHLNDEEYKLKKKKTAEIFIQRLNELYPGIQDAVDFYEVGTAKTIKKYTMNPAGSVYGFAQTPDQAGENRFPQKSPIKNLYFASAWTDPGGGVGAVLGSGYKIAKNILKMKKD